MTMRRLLAVGLILSALSIIPWVRACGESCCEPVIAADPEQCTGDEHDEAMQRYRCNQARHWRSMLIGKK